jgi:hypothetical protein
MSALRRDPDCGIGANTSLDRGVRELIPTA